MFPGHDINFDGVNTLNQFVTFGIATAAAAGSVGPIDWATLAQQWIQMRDHNVGTNSIYGNNIQMPEAPPPPNISGSITEQLQHQHLQNQHQYDDHKILTPAAFEEKGEADMDMDDEEEHNRNLQSSGIMPTGTNKNATNTQTMWMNQKLMETAPQWSWTARAPITTLPKDRVALMTSSEIPPPPPSMTTLQPPPVVIPSLLKINVPTPSNHNHHQHHHHHKTLPVEAAVEGNAVEAAKRKILPAWLREGIEKMEREKLKLQIEHDQKQTNDETDVNDEPINNPISDIVQVNDNKSINKTVKRKIAQTVTSDDDDDGHESSCNDESSAGAKQSNDNNDDDDEDDRDDVNQEILHLIEKSSKTYEEKISDLMMIVRRTLTELLLDVTNSEISNIAQETLKSRQAKASSAQVINKSALSSITGKLGLAVYDDSSSDGDSDDQDNAMKNASHKEDDNDMDSEEELKISIRMKRRNFARIAEQLEKEIADDSLKDEERLKYEAKLESYKKKEEEQFNNTSNKNKQRGGMSKSYEKDFGETSTDSSLLYSNGKRKQRDRAMRKERTTRFSDNNEPKTVALAAAANYLNQLQQNTNKIIKKTNNTQTSDYDDVSGANSSTSNAGLNNMLYAAEAALKKATKAAATFSSSAPLNANKTQKSDENKKKNKKRSRSRTRTNSRDSSRSGSSTSSSSTSKSLSYSSTKSSKRRKDKKSMKKQRHRQRRNSSASSDDNKRRRRDRDVSRNRSHYKSSSSNKRDSYERHYSRRDSRSRSRSSRRDRVQPKSRDDRRNRSCSSSRSRSSRSHSARSSVSRRKY